MLASTGLRRRIPAKPVSRVTSWIDAAFPLRIPLLAQLPLTPPDGYSTMSQKQLIVFDFDWSFVDQDTDRWVFEVLSTELRRKLQDRKSSGTGMQCTPDVV